MRFGGFGLALLLTTTTANAQLLPAGLGQLPGRIAGGLPALGGPLSTPPTPRAALDPLGIGDFASGIDLPSPRALLELRRARLRATIHDNRTVLDADPEGNPIRRAELLAVDLSAADEAAARAAGFAVARDSIVDGTGIRLTVLIPLRHQKPGRALKALQAAVSGVRADYNHVFEPAGQVLAPVPGTAVAGIGTSSKLGNAAIGLIDGGVSAHPVLANARIEQRGFAGPVAATGHGTAIASLLVGQARGFSGAATGARLLVADVYGGSCSNGSAEVIARALGWLATRNVRIVTISLVGPPNLLVERAIAALRYKGMLIVAAVGNDGPAAPPLYPASYDGVIAVTAVDAKGRTLVEAGHARHTDFAAPGADMAAALQTGGYAAVRGTSFAAPLVAARLAAYPDAPLAAVAREAEPGRRGDVGRGIVCTACRNDPRPLTHGNQG